MQADDFNPWAGLLPAAVPGEIKPVMARQPPRKLTDEQRAEIVRRRRKGNYTALAREFGISDVHVRRIPATPPLQAIRPWAIRIGDRIGEWTVLSYTPGARRGPDGKRVEALCLCRCSCGVEREVVSKHLIAAKRGDAIASRSCGHTRKKKE
jgi:hypothetical protein